MRLLFGVDAWPLVVVRPLYDGAMADGFFVIFRPMSVWFGFISRVLKWQMGNKSVAVAKTERKQYRTAVLGWDATLCKYLQMITKTTAKRGQKVPSTQNSTRSWHLLPDGTKKGRRRWHALDACDPEEWGQVHGRPYRSLCTITATSEKCFQIKESGVRGNRWLRSQKLISSCSLGKTPEAACKKFIVL